MQLNLRLELKADQFRNLRCSSQERQLTLSGCSSGFPTINAESADAIRTAGIVGQRLHVDVDFDSQREFDANNNLHVWYEGWKTNSLRRVEAGNVTFRCGLALHHLGRSRQQLRRAGHRAGRSVGTPRHPRAAEGQRREGPVLQRRRRHEPSPSIARRATSTTRPAGSSSDRPGGTSGYPAVDILQLEPVAAT